MAPRMAVHDQQYHCIIRAPLSGAIVGGNGLYVNAGSGVVTVVATKALDDTYSQTASTALVCAVKADQTITFPTIGKQRVTNTVNLAATASSGLPVTFEVLSGPGTITGGTNLTFTDRGTVEVKAYQAGDSNWNSAFLKQLIRVNNAAVYLDFDGDEKADVTVYVPESGLWFIRQSETMTGRLQSWGWENAVAVPADYGGDGRTDVAVYWPETGWWNILQSSDGQQRTQWGWNQAWSVPADYDGDEKYDVATYWAIEGYWYIWQSQSLTSRVQPWGWNDADPVNPQYWLNSQD